MIDPIAPYQGIMQPSARQAWPPAYSYSYQVQVSPYSNTTTQYASSQALAQIQSGWPNHYGQLVQPSRTQFPALQKEPKEHITDPKLYKTGLEAHGKIGGTEGQQEKLDSREFSKILLKNINSTGTGFQKRKSHFFKHGKESRWTFR